MTEARTSNVDRAEARSGSMKSQGRVAGGKSMQPVRMELTPEVVIHDSAMLAAVTCVTADYWIG